MLFFVLHTLLRAYRSIFLCVSRGSQAVCVEQNAGTVRCRRCDRSKAQGSEEIFDFTGGRMRKPVRQSANIAFDDLALR